jgi:hypothetical protein
MRLLHQRLILPNPHLRTAYLALLDELEAQEKSP